MTVVELHKILDDENKKITLKEYQEILFQLKSDAIEEQVKHIEGDDIRRSWYNGEMNGFQLALDLSEHIKEGKETDEQAKELAEIVSKEFWKGAIEQLVLMKDKSRKLVTSIKEKIKLDETAEYGFNLAVDCFEEVMNACIEELKNGANIEDDRKE